MPGARRPPLPDEAAVYRLIELFSGAYQRLESFPVPGGEALALRRLRSYRRLGLEGLKPKSRSDCGRPRAVSEALSEAIRKLLADHPPWASPSYGSG
ncbi:MAG: helix-turn-helix domain-containing protein [Acidobacteriota bacterium]